MRTVSLGTLNQYSGSTVNPMQYPDEVFELYSVPSYDSQYPEIIKGEDIGSSKVTIEPGDILICKINPRINRIWVVTHNTEYRLLASSEWIVVRSPENNADYLRHYFKSKRFQTMMVSQVTGIGGSLTRAQPKQVATYPVPLPDRNTQDQIANILNHLEQIIALRTQQLSSMDEMVKSRFIEMFGLPGTDTFGWGLVPLGSVCHINPKKSQDSRLVGNLSVSFVPMPAVTEHGEIDATEMRNYDEVKTGFTYFAENDVLFAKITPCMENGKGAVARGLHNGIGFGSTEFHVLRPLKGVSDPRWIYTLTIFPQFRDDAANNMTGSAGQRRVPASFLESYRVAVPPIDLQEQFAAFVTQTDKSKVEIQNALNELEILKKSLMQQYFG